MAGTQTGEHYLSATYRLTLGNVITAVPLLWSDQTLLSVLLDITSAGPPTLPDTDGFTECQIFDTYSPYVELYGSKDAQGALRNGDQVIVALRMSHSTRDNGGKGEYDDRMAIIWKETKKPSENKATTNTNGSAKSNASAVLVPAVIKHGKDFTANTQPSAQYEDPGVEWKEVRSKKTGKVQRFKVAGKIIGPDGKEVKLSKVEGEDMKGDGRRALGQLVPGTYAFYNNGQKFLNADYLRDRGNQAVNRDVNHDGTFTSDDIWNTPEGDTVIERGDFGIYIHRGGANNTWSAGCQTLPPDEHKKFFATLKTQKTYYYVLVTLR